MEINFLQFYCVRTCSGPKGNCVPKGIPIDFEMAEKKVYTQTHTQKHTHRQTDIFVFIKVEMTATEHITTTYHGDSIGHEVRLWLRHLAVQMVVPGGKLRHLIVSVRHGEVAAAWLKVGLHIRVKFERLKSAQESMKENSYNLVIKWLLFINNSIQWCGVCIKWNGIFIKSTLKHNVVLSRNFLHLFYTFPIR